MDLSEDLQVDLLSNVLGVLRSHQANQHAINPILRPHYQLTLRSRLALPTPCDQIG
jgi:hypothetical protein